MPERRYEKSISRRSIIKGTALAGGSLTLGTGISLLLVKERRDALQAKEITQLNATATAAVRKGGIDTFTPEGVYTESVFSKAKKAVMPIQLLYKDNSLVQGTGFVVYQKINSKDKSAEFVLATAKHVLNSEKAESPSDISEVIFASPDVFLDTEKAKDITLTTAISKQVDQGVIRFIQHSLPLETISKVNTIAHQDRYVPTPGEKLLMVTYPEIYAKNLINALTQGSVGTVQDIDSKTGSWSMNITSTFGASGGLVAKAGNNGEPIAVGMLIGETDDLFTGISTVTIVPLQLNSLIHEVLS